MLEQRLIVVGMNHRGATLDVREQYAVSESEVPGACRRLVAGGSVAEAVVLSTCNRIEVYAVAAAGAAPADAVAAVRSAIGPGHPSQYALEGSQALRHLFRVCSSLDSMVLGEPQIVRQVKQAFDMARAAGTVGTLLHAVFGRAFQTAKRVRTETGVARCAISVGYVAVELAKTIFGDVRDVEVLLIGAGKMGVLAGRNLSHSGARRVHVVNRTYERAKQLADRFGWTASAFSDIELLLSAVDVVVCSTGSPRPILTASMLRGVVRRRRYRPLFLIDIAVPRDIEPACGDLHDVYLYDIDALEEVSRTNAKGRESAALEAEEIVAAQVASFESWQRERCAAPTIRLVREKALEIARAEAAKTVGMLPGLDEKAASTVQKLAEVVANRLVRGTVAALKDKAGSPEGEDLAETVARLFDLEEASERCRNDKNE